MKQTAGRAGRFGLLARWALAFAAAPLIAGCDPISLTLASVGASVGVSQQMNGYVYRTFTAPMPEVKGAALVALKRMAIKVESTEKTEIGERINAKSADRTIELEIEAISRNTTRLRSIARKDKWLMDSATATEVILQTERAFSGA